MRAVRRISMKTPGTVCLSHSHTCPLAGAQLSGAEI
ncbi:hypothetical protein X946_4212 [Burkholderia sp. ABCPW 111]|nr:hypothetical protein X946_4212 [Burkholderia sp. ABCPW 111]